MATPNIRGSISFTILLLILLASSLCAQITNIAADQTPPIEGAGHDYIKMLNETVNPATGTVSLRINVPTPPSRGFSVPFSIGYDSNAALHVVGANYTDNQGYLARGGWSYLVPRLTMIYGDIVYEWLGSSGGGEEFQCHYYYDYMLTDLQGNSHALGISAVEPQEENPGDCSPETGVWLPGATVPYGADEKVQAVTTGLSSNNYSPTPVTVADTDGTVYYFPTATGGSNSGAVFGALPAWIEDRNGNKALFTEGSNGAFTVTDSAGRTSISLSSFGSTSDALTVSGFANPYSITWGTGPNPGIIPTYTITDLGSGLNCSPGGPGPGMPFPEITKIGLPNGQQYSFIYDPTTTLLQRVTYPSGGYIRYVWELIPQSSYRVYTAVGVSEQGPDCEEIYGTYALQNRYVSFNGTTEVLEQDFTYQGTWITNDYQYWTSKQTTVVTKDNVRGTSYATVYSYAPFYPPVQPNDPSTTEQVGFPVESQIVYYSDATEDNALRTVKKTYSDPDLLPVETDTLDDATSLPTSETSPSYTCVGLTVYNVCRLAVLTDQYDYDYGSGTPGAILKHTHIDYASFADTPIFPAQASILDRPKDVIVCQSTAACTSSNEIAETDYAYDGQAVSSVSSATEHDETNYSSSYNVRGNATTKTVKCLQAGCSNAISTYKYDETGQVLTMTDPCGNGTCSDMTGSTHTTTYSYSNSYTILSGGSNESYTPSGNTNAYLTKITNPLGQIEEFAYDYNSGELTIWQDQNDINAGRPGTTYIYNDPFARPTQVNYPDGGQTELAYNDFPPTPTVTTCQLINGTSGATCSAASPATGWKTDLSTMDGTGHVVQTDLASDPSGPDFTVTTYDGTGKPYQVYNPTRCSTPTTNCGTETTWGYTTTVYDALGRVTSVGEQDGSTISTSYAGNCTTMTDEAGHSRQSCEDGLGRMNSVVEDPGSSPHLSYSTTYGYDALSDLTGVTQNGSNSGNARIRSFSYDSLSRMTNATNPESGQILYSYDANSNLQTKTAPSPNQPSTGTSTVATSYTYDVLNRLTGKNYTDSYSNPQTSPVTYGYDGVNLSCPTPIGFTGTSGTNAIGRRSAMCYSAGSKSWEYDPMSRIHAENDQFIGLFPPYNSGLVYSNSGIETASGDTVYAYYLNGDLQGDSSPAWYEYYTDENGAGEVTTVGDEFYNVLTLGTYTPTGQLASAYVSGDGSSGAMQVSNTYNSRLQPVLMSVNSSTNTPILNLTYNFNAGNGTAGSGTDNGNVIQIANGKSSNRTQNFIYDPLNRIWQAYTNGTNWGQTYSTSAQAVGTAFSAAIAGIDSWGNLTNISPVTGKGGSTALSCATANVKNQLNTCFTYDAAGNLIQDGTASYFYDAENRLIATGGMSYIYDGDGNRIEKCTELVVNNVASPGQCATNATGMLYWLHQSGNTLLETDLGANPTASYDLIHGQIAARIDLSANVVHYYFHDHLGSTSIVTDSSGDILKESDYYPYGGEIVITNNDTNRYKFTGKERDTESGLDMFGARYYASTMGRFMTPDWAEKPTDVPYANFGNPQSLNLYGYVENNPTTTGDPDGHDVDPCGCSFNWQSWNTFTDTIERLAGNVQANFWPDIKSEANAVSNAIRAAAPGAMAGPDPVPGVGPMFKQASGQQAQPSQPAEGQSTPNVPNPYGSNGAPDHQQTADEEAAKMPNGQREVPVETPGGEKGSRRIDAANVENGKVTDAVQVIRPNKNGTPPKREVRAARDIENAIGVKPRMVPVRPCSLSGQGCNTSSSSNN